MCTILDANAVGEVFGKRRPPAGEQFFDWLQAPSARLAVGGRLYDELANHGKFEKWAEAAIADGRLRRFPREKVEAEEKGLPKTRIKSNDSHVIALARVSGARILYSDDSDLRDDFRNLSLVPRPKGRLYPMGQSEKAKKQRRNLLNRTDLCPNR